MGEVRCDELSKKGFMGGMAATPDGRMAVGYVTGGIDIFSAHGKREETVLKDVELSQIGFLSDGRYVVSNVGITLYSQECEKLDTLFDNDEKADLFVAITVDSNDQIYVGFYDTEKIQMFSPAGGQAIREIPCDGYEPQQITSYNDLLITTYDKTVRIVDEDGNVKHKVEKSNLFPFAAVTQNNSILIAWVKLGDGLVSIDEYTSELTHVQTLISDYKIEEPKVDWYYLSEFRSGEIAFCTSDRLHIFKRPITPRSP